jgi:predicted nucleic acid-binding protein
VSVLLLDAHVWLAAHDADDSEHDAARALVLGARAELAALDLTLYEVANVCTVRWHDQALGARLAAEIEAAAAGELVRCDSELIAAACKLADQRGLSVYDAAYAAAAARERCQLVSGDQVLVGPGLAITPNTALGQLDTQ